MSANKSFGPAAEGEGGVKTANVSLLRLPLVSVVDDGDGGAIIDAKGSLVAATEFFGESEQIVRAVNCHDQLVELLRSAHGVLVDATHTNEPRWMEEMWGTMNELAGEIDAALAAAKVPQ